MTANQHYKRTECRDLKRHELTQRLDCAVQAVREAGALMRKNLRRSKRIVLAQQHDIKLELDVRCQERIERTLQRAFPGIAILGEEGVSGDEDAPARWVVDPIDGTVNFTYGIPHACVSVALQTRCAVDGHRNSKGPQDLWETALGVVYDPFFEELWTGIRGRSARLNGRVVHASRRRRLGEAVISVGFAKDAESLDRILPVMAQLGRHARKVRIMGSAALGLVYVASGRFDAYIESHIRLWDIAAGGLILECAGGEFVRRPFGDGSYYRVLASNGRLRRELHRLSPELRKVYPE